MSGLAGKSVSDIAVSGVPGSLGVVVLIAGGGEQLLRHRNQRGTDAHAL